MCAVCYQICVTAKRRPRLSSHIHDVKQLDLTERYFQIFGPLGGPFPAPLGCFPCGEERYIGVCFFDVNTFFQKSA